MFTSVEGFEFEDGHADLSCGSREGWTGESLAMFCVGDADTGPVLLAVCQEPSGQQVDVDRALEEGFVHMHRSDSFRVPLRGDLVVGRTVYGPGDFRVQEAGKYYGPEGPGPISAEGTEPFWMLLVFADKRGYRIQAANDRDLPKIDAMEAPAIPLYDAAGCTPVHPVESDGIAAVATSLGKEVRTGHVDASFTDTDAWPRLGSARAAVMALGHPETGPLFLAVDTPPGEVAAPAGTWGTELVWVVVDGAAHVDGVEYRAGDIRIQEADAAHGHVVAGPGGLRALLLIGDRRAARPSVGGAADDQTWADDLDAQLSAILPVEPAVTV